MTTPFSNRIDLKLSGTKRFGELRSGIEGISQKVLTQNLRSMEEDGISKRMIKVIV
jgi:DNA-binding HxlR family transcriptional regulator